MGHSPLAPSLADGHLGWLHVFSGTNNSVIKTQVYVSVWPYFQVFFFNMFIGVILLGNMLTVYLPLDAAHSPNGRTVVCVHQQCVRVSLLYTLTWLRLEAKLTLAEH